MAMKDWKRDMGYWKGKGGWISFEKIDSPREHIDIGNKQDEDSPYHGMWFVDFMTDEKKGKSWFKNRALALKHAKKWMRSH